ncbi:hypothetical protein D3C86_1264390 [compost metagenome]
MGVEDTGGKAQDGVQVALVHQVTSHLSAHVGFKKYVIWQHDSGASTRFEPPVNMLEKGKLLVTGLMGEVVAGRAAATFGGAKGWI